MKAPQVMGNMTLLVLTEMFWAFVATAF